MTISKYFQKTEKISGDHTQKSILSKQQKSPTNGFERRSN
jgi:hypothetical protein